MTIFWAIILGIVQGLTEFFPISSSAHLALFPWIFNFTDLGLAFDVALHAGSLIAIIIALWPDWVSLAKSSGVAVKNIWREGPGWLRLEKEVTVNDKKNIKLVGFLLLTSIPGAIFGVLLESKAETAFRSPLLVAFNLAAFGVILWAADKYFAQKREIKEMKWTDSLYIGLAQAVALIPGVSRSGATITTGRALKFTREEAVRYSFMAAAPIIGGAALFSLRHVPAHQLLSLPWICGFTASLITSVWAMKFLLNYVKTKNFNIFVIWRFIMAAIVVVLFLARR